MGHPAHSSHPSGCQVCVNINWEKTPTGRLQNKQERLGHTISTCLPLKFCPGGVWSNRTGVRRHLELKRCNSKRERERERELLFTLSRQYTVSYFIRYILWVQSVECLFNLQYKLKQIKRDIQVCIGWMLNNWSYFCIIWFSLVEPVMVSRTYNLIISSGSWSFEVFSE